MPTPFDNSRSGEMVNAITARLKGKAITGLPLEAKCLVVMSFKVQLLCAFPQLADSEFKDIREAFDRMLSLIIPEVRTPEGQRIWKTTSEVFYRDMEDLQSGSLG